MKAAKRMSRRRSGTIVGSVVLTVISLLFAVIALFPIIWALFCSFQSESKQFPDIWDWFKPPYTIANYVYALTKTNIMRWFLNSLGIALVSTVLTVIVTTLAAYAIAKIPFKGKNAVFFYCMIGMLVPGEATIVPLFIEVNSMNLINTYTGLILPGLAGSMSLIICVSFFRGLPDALVEAVRIDGGGEWTIYRKIILPLSKPILSTTAIMSFIGSWNNYLWPLLCVFTEEMYTLPVGIPTFLSVARPNYAVPMTMNMVASIPAIILYIAFEKQITQGISMEGIKG
ncbi:MAG: carbohydrate ABC transporter permease [Lachnospiraceae bacterium]|jgi:multiple sugar transport system permease protein